MEDLSHYNAEGTELRKAQLYILNILVEVSEILTKNNIQHWLDAGTLLGAVRHGGYIPWDDDIDLSILDTDYKRAKKILMEQLPKHLAFQDRQTDHKFYREGIKIRDLNSYYDMIGIEKGFLKFEGAFIDIFPRQRIPSVKMHKFIDYFYGRVYRRIHGFPCSKTVLAISYLALPFVNIMAGFEKVLSFFIGKNQIGHVLGGYIDYYVLKKSEIFPLSEIEFEGKKFPCPHNYDAYLKSQYGDYMTIPPVDKRAIHASKIILFEDK